MGYVEWRGPYGGIFKNIKMNGFKSEYVYKLVSKLPYVTENSGIIKVVQ